MTTLLAVTQLRAGYGRTEVLHGVDLTVEAGEVTALLGANGAGKTTTLRALAGTLPRSGTIVFDGDDITDAAPAEIVRLGIAHVPQGRGTFSDLTVEENLRVGAHVRRDRDIDADLGRWYDLFPRLRERRRQKAGSLSGGEQQLLAIARALMSRPRLLLCDEPSLGLSPIAIDEVFGALTHLCAEQGLAVLLAEQDAGLARRVSRRAYALETGRVVLAGPVDDVLGDDALRRAYLGR